MQQCVSETTDTLRGGHCLARERSVGGVGRVGRQEPIDRWYQTPKFTIQPTSLALVLLHDQTCNARCHCGHRIAHRPHEDLTRATRGAYGKRPLGSDPPSAKYDICISSTPWRRLCSLRMVPVASMGSYLTQHPWDTRRAPRYGLNCATFT